MNDAWEIDTRHGVTVGPCRLRMPEMKTAKNLEKLWSDACLISAAPDMLATLKLIRFEFREFLGDDKQSRRVRDRIDAAIAKAERPRSLNGCI